MSYFNLKSIKLLIKKFVVHNYIICYKHLTLSQQFSMSYAYTETLLSLGIYFLTFVILDVTSKTSEY